MQSKTRFDAPRNRSTYNYEIPTYSIKYWHAFNQSEYYTWRACKEHRGTPLRQQLVNKANIAGHKAKALYWLHVAKTIRTMPN